MRRRCVVDSQSLTEPDARELERLLQATDLKDVNQHRDPVLPMPDMFSYKIDVEDGPEKYTVRVSDAQMSEALSHLITWLKEKSR
ncbi:MAG: hypothetical protein JOZ31_26390 [Verrucomicrobia bacterium]|nr:hypothetical protein [Verrucomicrobiota bacterium]